MLLLCALKSREHMYAFVFSLDFQVHCVSIMILFMLLICSQKQSIEMRREAVIRSLILYLGEKEEELFEDCLV